MAEAARRKSPGAPKTQSSPETTRLRQRRQRRGDRRDSALSMSLILSAARDEFDEFGLNGARVDRIAKRSGASKNLIYHYFGSKNGLYLAVLEDLYRNMRRDQRDLALQDLPPLEAMRELVKNTFDSFVQTPGLTRLMSIENIHYARNLKKSTSIKPLYAPLIEAIRTILKNGQREGVFRKNVDAVDLYVSISGLAYFYLSNRHSLSWLLDEKFEDPKRLAQRRAHVIDVIMGFLQHRARDG